MNSRWILNYLSSANISNEYLLDLSQNRFDPGPTISHYIKLTLSPYVTILQTMVGDARRWNESHKPRVPKVQPGDAIEDYHIEKKLGQGATGGVHKAQAIRGPLRGKVIAIKIVRVERRSLLMVRYKKHYSTLENDGNA